MPAFLGSLVTDDGNLVDDSENHQLIIELLLNDHREFLNSQKGKSRVDRLTDADVCLECWEEELQQQQQNVRDHRMAQSIADATVSDQSLLLQSLDDETIASSDHRLALSLADPDEADPDEAHQANSHYDLNLCARITGVEISEVLKDLAQLHLANDHGSSAAGPSNGISSNCISCLDAIRTDVFRPGCGHSYCQNCVHDHFVAATKDEELYPPRCCGQVFAPGMALRILNYKELSAFAMKGTEFSCKERTYCAVPTCSTFIPPWHIEQERAQCPQCGNITHTKCKTIGDPDHDCPSDPDLQRVLELGNEEGWRRCSHCRMLVELHQGCNHITCRYVNDVIWNFRNSPLLHWLTAQMRKTFLLRVRSRLEDMRLSTVARGSTARDREPSGR